MSMMSKADSLEGLESMKINCLPIKRYHFFLQTKYQVQILKLKSTQIEKPIWIHSRTLNI